MLSSARTMLTSPGNTHLVRDRLPRFVTSENPHCRLVQVLAPVHVTLADAGISDQPVIHAQVLKLAFAVEMQVRRGFLGREDVRVPSVVLLHRRRHRVTTGL